MIIHNPILTGSFTYNGADISSLLSSSANITSLNAATASLNTFSASVLTFTGSVNTFTGSADSRLSSLEAATASLYSATSSFSTRVGALESYTASQDIRNTTYATTGSNTLVGTQYISNTNDAIGFSATTSSIYTDGGLQVTKNAYFSSSMFVKGNLTVYGTQSVSFITSSQLNISTNLITVNTSTPSVRFGGLAVYDSGSTGLTGSILWDSQNNHWIYTNPSGSSYSGGMLISGPRNTGSIGDEQGTTLNAIMKGMGGDHITSSQMFDDGTTVRIPGALQVTGSLVGSSATFTSGLINGTTDAFFDLNRSASGNAGRVRFQTAGSDEFEIGLKGGVTGFHITKGDATELVTVLTSGSVGIGTTNPTTKLTIESSTYDDFIKLTRTGAGSMGISATNPRGIQTTDGAGNFIGWHVNPSGSVGIGTNSPGYTLDVSSGGSNAYIRAITSGSTNWATLLLTNGDGTWHVTNDDTGTFNIGTTADPSGNQKLTITSGGNAGIGTTNPVSTNLVGSLTIVKSYNGDTPTSTTAQNYYNNQSNLYLFGRNAGLTMVSNANEECVIAFASPSSDYIGGIRYNTESTAAGGAMRFQTSGSNERMRITPAGSVGIGTTDPLTTLSVKGAGANGILLDQDANSVNASSRLFFKMSTQTYTILADNNGLNFMSGATAGSSSGDVKITMNSAGSVGIGTTTPAFTLDVSGTGRFTSTISSTTSTTGATIKLGGFTNYGTIQDANDVRRIWFENVGSYRTIFDLPTSGTSFAFRTNDGTSILSLTSAGDATFNGTIQTTGITVARNVVGDPADLRVRNNNTGGYPSSIAWSIYGYAVAAAYFDQFRIQASYPGYGLTNFLVKYQPNSSEVAAIQIRGEGYVRINGPISGMDGSSANFQVNGFSRMQQIIMHNASNTAQAVSLTCSGADTFYINGALSKNSGSFRIRHPLASKKSTHQLVHSFIEGPKADLIYRGKIRLIAGRATVNMDEAATMTEGTFEALCREVQCFTSNESGWDLTKGTVEGNILTIESQNTESTDEISWLVIGERHDEHMMNTDWTDSNGRVIVEPLAPEETTII